MGCPFYVHIHSLVSACNIIWSEPVSFFLSLSLFLSYLLKITQKLEWIFDSVQARHRSFGFQFRIEFLFAFQMHSEVAGSGSQLKAGGHHYYRNKIMNNDEEL